MGGWDSDKGLEAQVRFREVGRSIEELDESVLAFTASAGSSIDRASSSVVGELVAPSIDSFGMSQPPGSLSATSEPFPESSDSSISTRRSIWTRDRSPPSPSSKTTSLVSIILPVGRCTHT